MHYHNLFDYTFVFSKKKNAHHNISFKTLYNTHSKRNSSVSEKTILSIITFVLTPRKNNRSEEIFLRYGDIRTTAKDIVATIIHKFITTAAFLGRRRRRIRGRGKVIVRLTGPPVKGFSSSNASLT